MRKQYKLPSTITWMGERVDLVILVLSSRGETAAYCIDNIIIIFITYTIFVHILYKYWNLQNYSKDWLLICGVKEI